MIDPLRPYDVVDLDAAGFELFAPDGSKTLHPYAVISQVTGEVICIVPTLELADVLVSKLSAHIHLNAFRSN